MSDNQEIEMNNGLDPMAILPEHAEKGAEIVEPKLKDLNSLEESVDGHSYFLGEVPQANLLDPNAFLPLNSDQLVGSENMVEKLLFEVGLLIEEEVASIQKHQKRIAFWEDRIEKNKSTIRKNEQKIKQNCTDALYDKKNRDYWFGRSEEVELDYSRAEVSNRMQDWSWLIKKYGLKNADGSEINAKSLCVEELCNGETKNLAGEFKATGERYEHARKEREAENSRLIRENSKLSSNNETLQGYISEVYTNSIEPLQDGILLLKELGVKLKSLGNEERSTYGQMRNWAEPFLNDFIRENSRVPQGVVTHFRRLTSIPLPPEYC